MAIYTIQFKRGKASNWSSLNVLLNPGEPGFEIDTGKLKIGDGTHYWNELPYVGEDKILIINANSQQDFPAIGDVDIIYRASAERTLYQWNDIAQVYEPLLPSNLVTEEELQEIIKNLKLPEAELKSYVEEKVLAEETRAKAAEEAAAVAAKAAQDDVDALETFVGTIPTGYSESNIVAFIQKRAAEVLAATQGGSSETAASIKAALDAYVIKNDAAVEKNADAIATIVADYLKNADKTELKGLINENAAEILRIDAILKAIIENSGEGLDSIKDLATWIEEHGVEAAGYAAAIKALEGLVGDESVANQIAAAIAAESLDQFASKEVVETLVTKVGDKAVSEAISDAIAALKIGDYAKAADLAQTAADLVILDLRVKALEDAGYQNADAVSTTIATAITNLKTEGLWDVKGAAATAETNANNYTNSKFTNISALSETDILAAIAAAN